MNSKCPRAVLTAVPNPRPYRRTKQPEALCHVLNFRKILFGHRENNKRPTLFKRKRAEAEASSSKIPKHS
ncbi:uncharacterized protein BYT42DRAFT_587338 [Radiomyces spectabilis]|uniref:uncharacterized protein n=1 Tax=Radiomyces spectabilis TaxID=64574 RepID=UPI00221EF660|nr:uncharacterized protein BYT42DRAFT_587338 [Radiomyces spectabilis]KAI8366643.1 hypothetical protein BYT42DRAFT_587338 [Radiomyces spectabilis]